MDEERAPQPREEGPSWFWLAALLPALLWVWPALANDPFPRLTGTGLVALGLAPAALGALVWPATRALGWSGFLLFAALAFGWLAGALGEPTDTFELRRAGIAYGTALAAFAVGARLSSTGLSRLGRAWTVLAAVGLVHAMASAWEDPSAWTGRLGNTGLLSQATLPGALFGLCFLLWGRGAWRGLGALVWLAYLLHALRVPVLAGVLASSGATILIALRPSLSTGMRGLALVLALVSPFLLRGSDAGMRERTTQETDTAAVPRSLEADLGGVEVRRRIWGSLLVCLADRPWTGLGPGQFATNYPPYRDPAEVALSRGGPCSSADTEVEHAHNDALHGLAELGLPAGTAWVGFLLCVLVIGLRSLRTGNPTEAAAAVALLGLWINGLFHAPWMTNPATYLGFVLAGHLVTRRHEPRPRLGRFSLARPLALAGLIAAWFSVPLVLHGAALGDYIASAMRIEALAQEPTNTTASELQAELARARRAVDRALQVQGDSVPARILRARLTEEVEDWRSLLALRPNSLDVHDQIGFLEARRGRLEDAHRAWLRALELSPGQARLLRSLARIEYEIDLRSEADARLDELERNGCLDPEWLASLTSDLLLRGKTIAGLMLLGRSDPTLRNADPNQFYVLAQELEQAGAERRAAGLRSLAQRLWAREHAARGDYATAVRSYRQALAPTRVLVPEGALSLRLELAAAELAANRAQETLERLKGLEFDPNAWSELPEWSRRILAARGAYGEDL